LRLRRTTENPPEYALAAPDEYYLSPVVLRLELGEGDVAQDVFHDATRGINGGKCASAARMRAATVSGVSVRRIRQSPRGLLRTIPPSAVGEHIKLHGVLRLQRRWVENTLPNYELLDATAVAFGKITELVHEAHRQIGLDPPETIHDDNGGSYDLRAMGWRFRA
jgi:hypothetical protein